ncbi:MAG: isochorismate synthase [Actinomycetia bacterium]|nr:isochorismate synthase [Actinomycetes bacterium]
MSPESTTLEPTIGDPRPSGVGASVVALRRRLAGSIDVLALHRDQLARRHVLDPSPEVGTDDLVLWLDPAADRSMVAWGATEELVGDLFDRDGPSALSASRRSLADRIEILGDDAPAGVGPVLVGGFRFSTATVDLDPDWNGFPDARLVLPRLSVVASADGVWVTATTLPRPSDTDADLIGRLEAILAELDAPVPDGSAFHLHDPVLESDPAVDPQYEALVARAVADIHAGSVSKVVAARRVTARGPVSVARVVDRLQFAYPDCVTFAVSCGLHTFLGATPERLVELKDGQISTAAVASTMPRGGTPEADARYEQMLVEGAKERSEHQFVVDDIRRRLTELGAVLDPQEPTGVMKLRVVQHLYAPITGRALGTKPGDVAPDIDILSLVAALHPTPAVAGTPTIEARAWIDRYEGLDRGWYAAPVGWCDLTGEGEFRVALRSALVAPDRIDLFAGAGLVADSDPAAELAETTAKLGPLLNALDRP